MYARSYRVNEIIRDILMMCWYFTINYHNERGFKILFDYPMILFFLIFGLFCGKALHQFNIDEMF